MPRDSSSDKTNRIVPPASKPVSLKFLAEHLGLSRSTISLVLNDSPVAKGLSQETRERVLRAAREFNYRPNFFARYLNNKRSYLIGVVSPDVAEGYSASVLSGIETFLLTSEYFFFTATHQWSPELVERLPSLLIERGAEGIILVNTPLVKPISVPCVSLGGHEPMEATTRVLIDNAHGAKLALQHLVNLSHRKIAFFKGHAGSADTEERWQGVEKAAAELGLKIDPKLVIQLTRLESSGSATEEGYASAMALLNRSHEFTALFAFNDMSAIGAMNAFRDAGLSIPDDVSVVGFDDVQAAKVTYPQLTTVRQPLRQIGQLAAGRLVTAIEQGQSTAERIMVQPELIVRRSSAAARTQPLGHVLASSI